MGETTTDAGSVRIKIRTDGKWKNFKYRYEVPADVLKKDFDYLEPGESEDGFFKYKGQWYHVSLFTVGAPKGWDGAFAFHYFGGLVIKLSPDTEQYMVGTYFS